MDRPRNAEKGVRIVSCEEVEVIEPEFRLSAAEYAGVEVWRNAKTQILTERKQSAAAISENKKSSFDLHKNLAHRANLRANRD